MSEPEGATPAKRRIFFALWPDDALRQQIERNAQAAIHDAGGRRIPAGNFHVTLVFIGEVPQEQVAAARLAASETAGHAFTLSLDMLESWTGADVLVYSGERPPAALGELVDRLRISLLRHQFKLQRQTFKPHVTLVRNLPRRLSKRPLPPLSWRVNDFVLVDSKAGPAGSIYTVMERWPLA